MFSILKPIISIAIGFGLSCLFCVLLMYISMIPSAIFKFIKIRKYAFVAIAVINFAMMAKYSVLNILWIIVSIVLFIIISVKYSATIRLSKQPNRKLKDDFDKANSQEWAYLYAFAIFVPIFLNLNYISGASVNIFQFYWSIDYAIIKYALLLTPIFLIYMAGHSAYTYGQDAVRNLEEERKQKEAKEQAEQDRLENLNPDRLDLENILAGADVDLPEADIQENGEQAKEIANEDTEDILQNIMNNLNK